MLQSNLIARVLSGNLAAFPTTVASLLQEQMGDKSIVPCRPLELEEYARLGLCEITPLGEPKPQSLRYWGGEQHDYLLTDYEQVVWQVKWEEHQLLVVQLQWDTNCGGERRNWVIANAQNIAESFILDVHRKTHAPGDAILVFTDGHWTRSRPLYEATQHASFDDLILADDLKESIRIDFAQFLNSETHYTRLGIAWRRGALFVGPPGNGKTHCVRALVKELGISSLYVQSLSHDYFTVEQLWQHVFDRARGLRPCVLVLEDLDSLVDDENRSFFLNQLDGFEQNHGMIILATTNYPERIDAAIIDRPSRFDRKYHFGLPTLEERARYLSQWQTKLSAETGWKLAEVDRISIETAGFSFAYLKELMISSVMNWMHHPSNSFADVVTKQANLLLRQMETKPAETLTQD